MQSFNRGDFVFKKGCQITEFFAVKEGRFAVVNNGFLPAHLSSSSEKAEKIRFLEKPNQIFGEIDALLQRPQTISAIALDASDALKIPTHPPEVFKAILLEFPLWGLKVCISFARCLKVYLDRLNELLRHESIIQQNLIHSGKRYLELMKELGQIPSALLGKGKIAEIRGKSQSHPLFELSRESENGEIASPKNSSIASCNIQPPSDLEFVREFSKGTCVCKADIPGDRMFVLVKGEVEVVFNSRKKIKISEPGSIFGEIATLLNLDCEVPTIKRTANVICATNVKALVIGLETIKEFFQKKPGMVFQLLSAIVERTKKTIDLTNEMKQDLRLLLFSKFKDCLEGYNQLSHLLEPFKDVFQIKRQFLSSAQEARKVFDLFKETKEILEKQEPSAIQFSGHQE